MKLLITGICGFVGSTIAKTIRDRLPDWSIIGIDNFIRRGSETNLDSLRKLGVQVIHGDLRSQSDVDLIPKCDWVLDAAANPSVLAGSDGKTSSRQLMEHNLSGTINLLEYCKSHRAGFILLSTSRVYSINHLAALPIKIIDDAFALDIEDNHNTSDHTSIGVTHDGIDESFPTSSPISLYGVSKLASESIALEYGSTFQFPVWINRCGVLAGAGQFGRADQGIFAYWINSHLRKKPLKYIGFDGLGHQVRDCLHPQDIVELIVKQVAAPERTDKSRISNVSGGIESAMSLNQLTAWCNDRFGAHPVASDPTPRPFDIPWCVLNSAQANQVWNWQPSTDRNTILQGIAEHAQKNPDWLSTSC